MSKLEQLINELCPNGVEWKPISDIGSRNKGMPITAAFMKKIENKDGDVHVFAAGNNNIMAFRKDLPGDNLIEGPAILVKSRGNIGFEFVNRTFTHKNELWSYTIKGDVNSKYVFYYLSNHIQDFQNTAKANSVKLPQLCVADTDNYMIPIPPLPVQEEIVRILDAFTSHAAELQAELQARREQYEYYRNKLLSFEDDSSVEYVALKEVATIKNGKDYKHLDSGDIPVYGSGGVMTYVNEYAYSKPSVLIPRKGSLGNLFYVDTPFWNVDTIFYTIIDTNRIEPKFLYYILTKAQLADLNNAGGVPSLTQSILNKVIIPIPPLSEQQRIVAILDKFEALVNDLTEGLPAEIAARQEQYEYYRDKLLNFPKAV